VAAHFTQKPVKGDLTKKGVDLTIQKLGLYHPKNGI